MTTQIETKPKLTEAEVEAAVLTDYEAVAGKIVLAHSLSGYNESDVSGEYSLNPPAIVRIVPVKNPEKDTCILRWMDDEHCDPFYDIQLMEPHPDLTGKGSFWGYGISRSINGSIEEGDFTLATQELQERYANAPDCTVRDCQDYPRPRAKMIVGRVQVGMKFGDAAIDVGDLRMDSTKAILVLDLETIHGLQDKGISGDDASMRVAMVKPVCDYFGVDNLDDITQQMLDEARAAHGVKVDEPSAPAFC